MADELIAGAIRSSEIVLDSDLIAVLQPLVTKWELAAARVAAAASDPNSFPLPQQDGGRTPEELLQVRFNKLPNSVQAVASSRALVDLRNPMTLQRVQRFGLNFPAPHGQVVFPQGSVETSHAPVKGVLSGQQVNARAPGWLDDIFDRIPKLPPIPPSNGPFSKTKLDLKLVRIRCLDETDGFLGSEAGMDEIEIGGSAIDPTKIDPAKPDVGYGDAATTVPAFRVQWKFNDGTAHDWPNKHLFHSFDVSTLNEYPSTYFVTMIMAEIDRGDFSDGLDAILKGVEKEAVEYLTAAIGGAIGTGAGPLGTAIGLGVGYAVGKVFEYIRGLFDDKVFDPVTLQLTIPSANPASQTIANRARFRGPGHYLVACEWSFS